jgi:cytochrome c551/c552
VVDTLTLPLENPYRALWFVSGHDFFSQGDLAVCTAHGDVWRVSDVDASLARLRWRRLATGLFQPLGLKIVDDQVYVLGRDQITRLVDRDGDGEADRYEVVSNAGPTSPAGHDYATCLETDTQGNFYYLDANEGLVRVARDGSGRAVLASGLRNPNGMSVGPGGVITVSPQEGEWTPASAIVEVREGGFYGYQGLVAQARRTDVEPPLCWLPRRVDNSSGGQVWVNGDRWGPLAGELLHLSYGKCRLLLVLREPLAGAKHGLPPAQGGVVEFPLEFASGVMRGRFSPRDGQLYVSGLKGWVSAAAVDGCLQRVRYTGGPLRMPRGLRTVANGLVLEFSEPLDQQAAEDPDAYRVERWGYRYSAAYGSPELRLSQPQSEGRDEVEVRSATLLDDRRSVFLELAPWGPAMQYALDYAVRGADGVRVQGTAYLTIHALVGPRLEPRPRPRRPRPGQLPEELAAALRPGLALRATLGGAAEAAGVSRLAALDVPAARGPVWARWEGYLKLPRRGTFQFQLAGQGTATLALNGQPPCRLDGSDAVPAALHTGYNQVVLEYSGPSAGGAALRLLWSSDDFRPEPVPPALWWHDARAADLARAAQRSRGRALVAGARCLRCHAPPEGSAAAAELAAEGPALDASGGRLQAAWLYHWLLDPRGLQGEAQMPSLLNDDPPGRQTAADLAAFLQTQGAAATPPAAPSPGDPARGRVLYEDLGCLACHRLTRAHEADGYGRLSLYYAASKFAPGQLAAYLARPQAHYAWTRMPDFRLQPQEAAALAAYLAQAGGTLAEPAALANASAERGRAAWGRLGCGQCHGLEGAPAERGARPLGSAAGRGCLAPGAAGGAAPRWAMSDEDRAAAGEFLSHPGEELPGQELARLWTTLRCGACHVRDSQASPRVELLLEEGEQGLPPEPVPALTWAGEKLRPDWMEGLLAGRPGPAARPWLKVRMPSFPAYAKQLARGLAAEHGMGPAPPSDLRPDPALVEAGRQLTQAVGGLDCRQCHGIGPLRPEGDAQTHFALGVNLAQSRARLQREYYDRWMRDPLRIDPQTKMPKLASEGRTKALGHFEGDAPRQFEALWHFLQSLEPEGAAPRGPGQ